jgi:hypothetical protein
MRTNRSIYASECSKLSGQADTLKTKLSTVKDNETILDNGITSNSKIICELLNLELYDIVSKHPETKLQVTVDNEMTEFDIHRSNVKKIIRMYGFILYRPVHKIESVVDVKLMVFDVDVSAWVSTSLDSFEVSKCLEVNERKTYAIRNVGIATVNFIWINSQVSFITKNLNRTEKMLLDTQFNFNLLDKSMRYLEEPFEDLFKNIKSENFEGNTNLSDYRLSIIEKNELDMTEKVEGMISKVTGNI